MKSRKPSASWKDMRRLLAAKSHEELLQLIRDLYALRPEVKDFLHARLQTSTANVKPYKKTIQESLFPDVIHGEDLDLARGQKAISDYKKATNDPIGTLDLMVYYVECGTQFAVEYGYGDEEFFERLLCPTAKNGIESCIFLPSGYDVCTECESSMHALLSEF